MQPGIKSFFVFFFLILVGSVANAQAELIIKNTSGRSLTIKVMSNTSRPKKVASFSVKPFSEAKQIFNSSGQYFLKTKAAIQNKEPLYSKGDAFKVYVGTDGYSVLTVTYSVKETPNSVNVVDGKKISKAEFDTD